MDNVVKKNIEKFLSNVGLFYSIIKNKLEKEPDDIEEVVSFLKMQHSSNKSLLMDLGVIFDEISQIRALNEQVRRLESQIGKESTISFESISNMIEYRKKELENKLSDIGIYSSCHISASFDLTVKVKIFSQSHKFNDSYSRNEEEKNRREKEHFERLERLKDNFETYTSTEYNKEEYIIHSQKNIDKINSIVLDYFGHSTFASTRYESKVEDDRVYIYECEYSLPMIDSYKNFITAFRER